MFENSCLFHCISKYPVFLYISGQDLKEPFKILGTYLHPHGEREALQETWQDIWQDGGAQDVTHTPNPIFNPPELPLLKLSLVGVWHNIKTCRRLQWQAYSLGNSCVNKVKLL